jgi:bifunctional DNase/RNase
MVGEVQMGQDNMKDGSGGDLVKMIVAGVTLDPSNNMPIIILKAENDDVAIPIWIGLIEASAIATELEGIKLARPMTHDLLKNVLEALGGKLERIIVCDLKDNTFYATLIVYMKDTRVEIDSRPSDAIALALRAGADIYVAKKVIESSQHVDLTALKEAMQEEEEGEEGEKKKKDKWTEILENLRPEDFGKYKM